MTQDLNAGSIGPNTTMSHFATNAYGQPWTMCAPLIEDGFANATIPQLNMYGNSSVPSIPHIRGGYTSFLLGVDQAATLHAVAKKLNFD